MLCVCGCVCGCVYVIAGFVRTGERACVCVSTLHVCRVCDVLRRMELDISLELLLHEYGGCDVGGAFVGCCS